jgi:hypothetical protein
MESTLSLALATKLKMLFEKEDRFLTFPLGLGFTYKYLNFMKDPSVSGLTLQEHLNNRADFARLLNIIPEDTAIFSPDANRLLWKDLMEVLNASIFAVSVLTEAENTLLDRAIDFLTDLQKQADGTQIPVKSTAVIKYYEYRDTYQDAVSTYLNEKIAIENSTGPEGEKLRQQWAAYREKQLLTFKSQAEDDWKNVGFKEQVEYYQSVRNSLEPKKYLNLYRQAYLDEINISEIPDLNGRGIGFYTTFFSPFDVFDTTIPWLTVTLNKEEINRLAQDATPEMKAIFNAGGDANGIDAVSLECNNVVVIRPWYRPEFFVSKYWKLPDETVVSDGNVPCRGRIPAYITSMIVVRNVKVTRKRAAPSKPLVLTLLSKIPIETLKINDAMKPAGLTPPPKIAPEVRATVTPRFTAERIAVTPRLRQPLPAEAPGSIVMRSAAPLKSTFFLKRLQPALAVDAGRLETEREIALDVRLKEKKSYLISKYLGEAIKKPVFNPPLKPPASPVEELVTETYNLDGVAVLAFACRRTPKSPDPDGSLQW